MSGAAIDAIVSSIIDDLNAGASLPQEQGSYHFNCAVHTLRASACKTDNVITEEQRKALDAAIRAAQPMIVGDPISADLRIMVCALHIVTAEWANPNRSAEAVRPNVMEAFILTRMLDNHLDNANLRNVLGRQRALMAPEQWRWLGDMVEELYPLPTPMAEPIPFVERVVH